MFHQVGGVGRGCIPSRNARVRGNHNCGSAQVSESVARPTSSIVLDKRLHVFICAKFSTNPIPGGAPKAEDNFDVQEVDDALVKRPARVGKFVFAALQVNFSRSANENEVA